MENTTKVLEKPLTEPETQRVSISVIWFEDSPSKRVSSKSTVETLEKSVKFIDAVLVSLLLTLTIFYSFYSVAIVCEQANVSWAESIFVTDLTYCK